jgi:hypothetical protein
MALYEMRTYALRRQDGRGRQALYRNRLPCALSGGQAKKLVGYFQSDVGTTNSSTSGNSRTTPIAASIGPQCWPMPPRGLCRQIPTARHDAARQGYAAGALRPPSLIG